MLVVAKCPMETSQPLAIESFSYSWLSNVKRSLDIVDEPFRASDLDRSSHDPISKELDYKIVKSKKYLAEAQGFSFDIPTSQSTAALLHADEIFSDGFIKPVFIDPSKIEASCTLDFITILPDSSFPSRNLTPSLQGHYYFLRKWRKSSKKILQKCFGYLRTGCLKVGSSRKSNRVDDIDRRAHEVKSWNISPQASPPQQSTAYSVDYWYEIENSIYEAVLHCKRSLENDH